MIDIDKNLEQQLYIFEFLASFRDAKNSKNHLKKSSFKILNAIYLFTKRNIEKGRSHHYPGINLICKMANIKSRTTVSKFLNSEEIGIFCEVINKDKFTTHEYKLKDWVFEWMRLFWRFGMMKHFHTNWKWWHADFKKRINNWLVPLVQKGKTIKQIYQGVLNKLSTANSHKMVTANPHKMVTIKSPRDLIKHSGSNNLESLELPSIRSFNQVIQELHRDFKIGYGDLNTVIKNFTLHQLQKGLKVRRLYKERGLIPRSEVATFIGCIKKTMPLRRGI